MKQMEQNIDEHTGVPRAVLTTFLVLKLVPNKTFLNVYQNSLCSTIKKKFIHML